MKSGLIVSDLGLDNHRAFSRVTARDATGAPFINSQGMLVPPVPSPAE